MKYNKDTLVRLKKRIRRPGRHSKNPNKSYNGKKSRGQG